MGRGAARGRLCHPPLLAAPETVRPEIRPITVWEWLILITVLVWLLIGFIAAFAFSQGSMIWVYISEVFPTAVRAKGQSLGSSTHWIMNALISLAFPIVAVRSKAAPFVFFSAMMALQFLVVFFSYPETKNVVLEDMEKKLAGVGRSI